MYKAKLVYRAAHFDWMLVWGVFASVRLAKRIPGIAFIQIQKWPTPSAIGAFVGNSISVLMHVGQSSSDL